MRVQQTAVILLLALTVTSCASVRTGPDRLCNQIAIFANATPKGSTHSVALTNIWGPTKEHPDSLMYKHCEDGDYTPGTNLCQYLMANTSTEFPERDFRRALACISGLRAAPPKYVTIERIDTLLWGIEVPGVRPDVSVGVEFVAGGNRTPVLKLTAEAELP